MHWPDALQGRTGLPSCGDCGQHMAVSCRFLHGLPDLQRATLPNEMSFYQMSQIQRLIKARIQRPGYFGPMQETSLMVHFFSRALTWVSWSYQPASQINFFLCLILFLSPPLLRYWSWKLHQITILDTKVYFRVSFLENPNCHSWSQETS